MFSVFEVDGKESIDAHCVAHAVPALAAIEIAGDHNGRGARDFGAANYDPGVARVGTAHQQPHDTRLLHRRRQARGGGRPLECKDLGFACAGRESSHFSIAHASNRDAQGLGPGNHLEYRRVS